MQGQRFISRKMIFGRLPIVIRDVLEFPANGENRFCRMVLHNLLSSSNISVWVYNVTLYDNVMGKRKNHRRYSKFIAFSSKARRHTVLVNFKLNCVTFQTYPPTDVVSIILTKVIFPFAFSPSLFISLFLKIFLNYMSCRQLHACFAISIRKVATCVSLVCSVRCAIARSFCDNMNFLLRFTAHGYSGR